MCIDTPRRHDIHILYIYPIGSMYGIFANIWLKFMVVNVGKYSMRGASGYIYRFMFLYIHPPFIDLERGAGN